MPALRKPLLELVFADFEALIRDKWVEDELLEFKRTLATSKGDPDRWMIDQTEIGTSAKRDLLAEVVAMANSYGGDVILGVAESVNKPPSANAIVPLPRCVELAHRLELAARDLIKPEIPMLGVRGVPTDDDSGVVVFRVPKSRSAPHRLEMKGVEKECYKRVGDRTEAMTMREIRDLTFSAADGMDAINKRFNDLRSEFIGWTTAIPLLGGARRQTYRVSAIPQSADLYIDRVHGNDNVRPVTGASKVALNSKHHDLMPIADPYAWRPVLRGTQSDVTGTADRGRSLRLSCDGTLQDMTAIVAPAIDPPGQRSQHVLFPGWIFASIVNTMRSVDRFRRAAGAQSIAYALEFEVMTNASLPVLDLDSTWLTAGGTMQVGAYAFPRYQVGEPESWSDTLGLMWRDLWNSIGVDVPRDQFRLVN
jgi:hypothetical protein